MNATFRYFFYTLLITSLYACHKNDTGNKQHDLIATQMKKMNAIPRTRTNGDSLLKAWELLDDKLNAEKDSALSANVKYNMAELLAMKGNDSAQFYVERALALIEPTKGNLKEKALIYNGMGNIWVNKGKRHQANYYYNKAAAIVMADTALPLSAEAKTAFLLSAAQSNRALFQYGLAQQMNRAALALVPRLPAVHTARQRSLVQIIQTMAVQNAPANSIKRYLDKLEALHRQHPDDYEIGYLYESKTKYFERIGQKDSLLYYELKKAEKDEIRYQLQPSEHVAINSLFITYINIGGTYVLLNQVARAEGIYATGQGTAGSAR